MHMTAVFVFELSSWFCSQACSENLSVFRVTTLLTDQFRVNTSLENREMSVILLKREKILLGKSCLKLFIVSCIFVSIQVFSTSTGMIWVTLNMPSAAEECREPSGNCQVISHCLESGHPVSYLLQLVLLWTLL